MVYSYLKRKGYKVLYLREPGGTRISEKIRKILLDSKNRSMTPACEMLLYMAARAQAVGEVIKPALRRGFIVISDRFLDSTLVYQGYALGMDIKVIQRVGNFVTCGIKPGLTILMDLPVEKGIERCGRIKDRIEERPLAYHRRVRDGYLKLAQSQRRRIRIVKVDKDKSVTQENIRRLVLKFLEKQS
jgi:dTMP kinase